MTRLICATIDLDSLRCYLDNRGLGPHRRSNVNAVYDDGLPRFIEVFERHRIPATFFAVGEDARSTANAAVLRRAAERGHEIASHSHTHPQDFSALGPAELRSEIAEAARVIASATGVAVRGFRSPSWNVTRGLFALLAELGYQYDSSLVSLPASQLWSLLPPLAPQVFGGSLLLGQSRWPRPPSRPYPLDCARPWKADETSSLWEVPNGVTGGWLPLPLNATALAMLGRTLEAGIARWAARRPEPLVLVFHGIDLVDFHSQIADPRLSGKPGITAPLAAKVRRVERLLRLMGRGRTWTRLTDLVKNCRNDRTTDRRDP